MDPDSLGGFLKRHKKIGLDSSVFIFEVEQNPKYAKWVHPIFQWLEEPRSCAVTSTVAMLELLVHPYRRSDIDAVNKFYALLSTYPGLQWVELTLSIADLGARLRAEHNLKTPDAIQAATAILSQATGFISNDPAFKRVGALEVLVLDDLTSG
jgi:predicted nucleic acid-binding protein